MLADRGYTGITAGIQSSGAEQASRPPRHPQLLDVGTFPCRLGDMEEHAGRVR